MFILDPGSGVFSIPDSGPAPLFFYMYEYKKYVSFSTIMKDFTSFSSLNMPTILSFATLFDCSISSRRIYRSAKT